MLSAFPKFVESAEIIALVWLKYSFSTKLDSCDTVSLLFVCITWEYSTTIHSDARFNPKDNLISASYIRDANHVNNEVSIPRDHLAH